MAKQAPCLKLLHRLREEEREARADAQAARQVWKRSENYWRLCKQKRLDAETGLLAKVPPRGKVLALLRSIETAPHKVPRGLNLGGTKEFAHHRYLIRAGYAEWVPRPDFVELRITPLGIHLIDTLAKTPRP